MIAIGCTFVLKPVIAITLDHAVEKKCRKTATFFSINPAFATWNRSFPKLRVLRDRSSGREQRQLRSPKDGCQEIAVLPPVRCKILGLTSLSICIYAFSKPRLACCRKTCCQSCARKKPHPRIEGRGFSSVVHATSNVVAGERTTARLQRSSTIPMMVLERRQRSSSRCGCFAERFHPATNHSTETLQTNPA